MDALVCEVIDALQVQISKEDNALTSVVVAYDLEAAEAEAMAAEIFFLNNGKIETKGTARELHSSKDLFVRQFFAGKVYGPMTSR